MLSPLIFIYFILVIQTVAEDGLALSLEVLADATEQATKLQKEADKSIKEILANNPFAYHFFENGPSKKGCPSQGTNGKVSEVKGCVKNMPSPIPKSASTEETLAQNENADQILVFVSFSMPEASLKSLAQEAQRDASQRVSTQGDTSQGALTQQHHVMLVMRGLYQDSFAKTAQKLQELGISIDINPELFEKHHIASVPTFVLVRNSHAVLSLKGNVTLSFVAKEFNDHVSKD